MIAENKKKSAGWMAFSILLLLLCTSWINHDIYEATIPYGTLIAFVSLSITFFIYENPFTCLKNKDMDFYIMVIADVIALVNLFLIRSGKGAILIIVDICLIFYLCNRVIIDSLKVYIISVAGVAFFLFWTFNIRWYYNTNMGGLVLLTSYLFSMLLCEQLKNTNKKILMWILWAVFTASGYRVVFYYYEPMIDIPQRVIAFTAVTLLSLGALLFGQITKKLSMGYIWTVQLMMTAAAMMSVSYYLSRTALVGILVFAFLIIMPKKVWNSGFLYKLLCIGATAGGIAFSVLYVWMGTVKEQFQLRFLYKDILSGREEVWSELWDAFVKQPLTGIGSSYVVKVEWMEGMLEVHNGMLDLLLIHGIIVFAFVFFLILKRLFAMQEFAAKNQTAKFASAAIFAMLFTSFFENYFIVPPFSLIVLFFFGVVNAQSRIQHHNKND